MHTGYLHWLNVTFKRNRHLLWGGICLLLTLPPMLNMMVILATTGVDTVSNDYLMFVQVADRFLTGQHDWRLYFQDTLYTHVHSYAFLFPIRMLLLRLSHLNVYAEICAGFLLAIVRLALFYRLLTIFLPTPPGRPWYRSPHLWLLPILSALVFANAQITTFSYGETSLQFGLTQLLILLGLLLLLRWPQRVHNLWLATLCGLLASYSGGSGLLAWPVFLLALLWRQRRPTAYLAWTAGLLSAAWPYLTYSAFGSLHNFQSPRLQPLLIGLGLPFANNINDGLLAHPQAMAIGLLGLFLAASSLGLLWKLKPGVFACQAIPALLLMAWSLFYALQVMLSRTMIAPWYTTTYSLFWVGLLGLLPLLLTRSGLSFRSWPGWRVAALPGWGMGLMGLMGLLYGQSNLTYTDKSFYLNSRSPASAACLRHYLNAPTYCEGLVFQWSQGTPANLAKLGQPLALHQLSVFATEQEWTLQGDYVLGTVQWSSYNSQLDQSAWVRGQQDQPAPWSDYHHLNVLIPPGQSIRWQLNLPVGLRAARFTSAVSLPAGINCALNSAFSISLEDERGANHLLLAPVALCSLQGWQALDIDLTPYAGQHVTLVFDSTPGAAGALAPTARLRFPRIHLSGVPASRDWQGQARPSNTDLSPDLTAITASAYRLPVGEVQGWQLENLLPGERTGRYIKNSNAAAARFSLPEAGLCLADWSQFYLQIALPDTYWRKLVQVRFDYLPVAGPPRQSVLNLPLLSGEALHTYTLNLDLLAAPPSACITGVELELSYPAPPLDAGYWIELIEAGFLARSAP